jgi:hypothetical protein
MMRFTLPLDEIGDKIAGIIYLCYTLNSMSKRKSYD